MTIEAPYLSRYEAMIYTGLNKMVFIDLMRKLGFHTDRIDRAELDRRLAWASTKHWLRNITVNLGPRK